MQASRSFPIAGSLVTLLFATLQDAGGPSIPMRFGRTDAQGPESAQPEGNLPGAPACCACWETTPVLCVLTAWYL